MRATLLFVVLLVLFYGTVHSPGAGGGRWRTYLRFHAGVVASLLNVLGAGVTVDDTTIVSNEFAMEIVRGCDAIEPMAVYVAAVIASPAGVTARLVGCLMGSVALLVINWLRLVMLYFVGVYWRSMFEVFHESLWQAMFVGLAIVFWAVWVDWATRSRGGGRHASAS